MKYILFFLMASVFPVHVYAGIYKCTDAEGKTIYRPHPCTEGFDNRSFSVTTGVAADPDSASKQEATKQQQEQQEQIRQQQEQQQRRQKMLEQAAAESQQNQIFIKENPGQFSAYAIPPYAPDKLSSLVKKYEDRLPEVERFRRFAAQKALATGECGRVEAVELNEKSSPNSLVYLINCSSAQSFYFSEQELAK